MRSSFDFVKLFSAFLALILLCSIPAVSLAKEGSSIVLTFTGDCTLGNEERLNYQPYSFVGVVKEQGFDYPFAKVKELFESDDLTIINLENVFCDTCNGKASKTYNFKSPTSFAEILPKGSVELAFIGNNHILDYGSQGLNSTLKALKDQGVPGLAACMTTLFITFMRRTASKSVFLGPCLPTSCCTEMKRRLPWLP